MMKGAIQVSIGFLIVMVISALVMIFMMGWLSDLFPQLTDISTYATSQAERQMTTEFAKGGDRILATIPSQQTFPPGSKVSFKIGIRKTAEVDNSDYFALCVGKGTGIRCTSPPPEQGTFLIDDDDSGIKFQMSDIEKVSTRGEISISDALMEIGEVVPGTYRFKIYVCANSIDDLECLSATGNVVPLTSPSCKEIVLKTDINGDPLFKCNGLTGSYGDYSFIIQIQ